MNRFANCARVTVGAEEAAPRALLSGEFDSDDMGVSLIGDGMDAGAHRHFTAIPPSDWTTVRYVTGFVSAALQCPRVESSLQPASGHGHAPMTTERFYADLPVISDFGAVADLDWYTPLPDDWHIALCDVRNSTAAVLDGKYKNVNTLGAAAITSVLNAAGDIDVPFSFEGDGSVLCIPPRVLDRARAALAMTQTIGREGFGLDLRIATVSASDLRVAGYPVLVARYAVSADYIQAIFAGGGIACAERLIKNPQTCDRYVIAPGSVVPEGSHDGLECRWQDIRSRHGETVSLMVQACSGDRHVAAGVYRDLIAKIRDTYGGDDTNHPVALPALDMTLDASRLDNEVAVRAAGRSLPGKWLYLMKTRAMVLLGRYLMSHGTRTAETDWGQYKSSLVQNTDFRKFVDVYRQILAGTGAQRDELTSWLEDRYQRHELVYGMHVSDRAHMTCIVFNYAGRHMHFVDGADGGLFLAAKAFKERAALLKATTPAVA